VYLLRRIFNSIFRPDLLGDKAEFRKRYEDPIVKASHKNAKEMHKSIGSSVLAKLKGLIAPHFVRRKGFVFCCENLELFYERRCEG
jgi:SNF2 family DNA or RNA helicase